jgi:hypothetical protein
MDLLQTPVFHTLTKILPEIQRSMALEFTLMDASLQEQFLIVWILTLKMIDHATRPGTAIPLLVGLEEVAIVYEAFSGGHIDVMGTAVVSHGSVADHNPAQSVNNVNRYIGVKKGVNTVINFINQDDMWREKVKRLEGDLATALKGSIDSLQEKLLKFTRNVSGYFFECVVYTLGVVVAVGGIGGTGVGIRRVFWSGNSGSSESAGGYQGSGESTVVATDTSDPYGTPLGFFQCECGMDVSRTASTHETSRKHRSLMQQKNKKDTMSEAWDLLPQGIQTRAAVAQRER